jgi:hypothetical protein
VHVGVVRCNVASEQLSYISCILKQLGLELLINPWDGLASLDIKWFGAMMCDSIELLCAKLPYNFGGWRDFLVFHNKFERFTQNIKMDTYLHKKDLEMMTNFVESMQLWSL